MTPCYAESVSVNSKITSTRAPFIVTAADVHQVGVIRVVLVVPRLFTVAVVADATPFSNPMRLMSIVLLLALQSSNKFESELSLSEAR